MAENILVCATNWLGDSIMSMPAVQALRRRLPEARITILAKPRVASLWRLHPAADEVMELLDTMAGLFDSVNGVRARACSRAFVLPNSFRSALVPCLAGVPVRVGMPGHQRAWMLTRSVEPPTDPAHRHQAWEYLALVEEVGLPDRIERPCLTVPEHVVSQVKTRLGPLQGRPVVALIPGAARGPSKRWPAEHFVAVGRRLAADTGCGLVVVGSALEAPICGDVAAGLGAGALDLSGKTSLAELAALLGLCRLAVTNDSGGMHLAAASGTPVVAVFGLTDPATTGPLGEGHRILCAEGVQRSRDIARDSEAARDALASIRPERVTEAALDVWRSGTQGTPDPKPLSGTHGQTARHRNQTPRRES